MVLNACISAGPCDRVWARRRWGLEGKASQSNRGKHAYTGPTDYRSLSPGLLLAWKSCWSSSSLPTSIDWFWVPAVEERGLCEDTQFAWLSNNLREERFLPVIPHASPSKRATFLLPRWYHFRLKCVLFVIVFVKHKFSGFNMIQT